MSVCLSVRRLDSHTHPHPSPRPPLPTTGSARNLAVKVQLMAGEEEVSALCCIMGRSSCPELSTEAITTVSYHSSSPDFYDEVTCVILLSYRNNTV